MPSQCRLSGLLAILEYRVRWRWLTPFNIYVFDQARKPYCDRDDLSKGPFIRDDRVLKIGTEEPELRGETQGPGNDCGDYPYSVGIVLFDGDFSQPTLLNEAFQ